MPETDDIALLKQFAENGSETAFVEIVSRHLALVYSTALRAAGNAHAAQEISQAVFIILARKAKSLGAKTVLSGWLYQTTKLTAANYLRGEIRRQNREQEAFMQSTLNESESEAWRQIAPILDDAISRLGAKDRDAIVLRFFENKSLGEVGAALGASEDAAKMRVNRALEKLRKIFSKRGGIFSAAVIAGAISANSVQAAPSGLAQIISAAAIAKGAAAGGSTLSLVKGALKIMAWTKMKTAVIAGAVMLLAAGTTIVVVEKISQPKLSATDLSWADDSKYWETDSRVLQKLPPVMIIRPTKFTSGGGVTAGDCIMQRNASIKNLLDTAYDFDSTRTIFPANMPKGSYDLMYTLPTPPSSVLPQEMAKRFGYVARKENRQTDVLLLKVANPNPPNLKPAQNKSGSSMSSGGDKTVIGNQGIATLAGYIQGLVNQPVLDRTGLKDTYDITLQTEWKWNRPSKAMLDRALLEQLGLELVPSREPIEMLVVEQVK